MQFQVPQFTEAEDKIVGPLTLRQFIYIAAAGGVSVMLYFAVITWLWAFLSMFIWSIRRIYFLVLLRERNCICSLSDRLVPVGCRLAFLKKRLAGVSFFFSRIQPLVYCGPDALI